MIIDALTKKILILAANPIGTTKLRLDEEFREIQAGLERAQKRNQFILEQRWAVRPRDIQHAMLDINPQIVHFSGHGAGDEGLVFEDETGQAKLVDGEALAGLFELFAEQVECVVLNGCYSQVQAEVIAQHIPYVIGMSQAIGDQAAIEFAVGFYDALGAGRPIEFAYKLGCNAIRMSGIAEHLTPVLIKKPEPMGTIVLPNSAVGSQSAKHDLISSSVNQRIEVFFSYAHEDEKLRDELTKQLKTMIRQKLITAWYDRDITAGSEWAGQIDKHLNTAQIVLLLISPDFINSDYCYDIEMKRAMERHQAGEACVVPIILRPTDWKGTPFENLQALPKDAIPVTKQPNRDQAFLDIANEIRRVVEKLKK
ncbi:MAG: TIR domain-containing protein [Prochloraceae cyanobacterium]|nr:TIR domain-containing protein [Prochloraceae cyanobacterium]